MKRNIYFDDYIKGSGVYMLQGAEGMGKTTFAFSIMEQMINEDSDTHILYFHTDPLPDEIDEENIDKRIRIVDTEWLAGESEEGIFLQACWMMQDHKLGMVVVDDFYELLTMTYFEYIKPSRRECVAYLLTRFKTLAELFDIPVVLIARSPDDIYEKKDEVLQIPDIKDKKLIKEFVDKIIIMYTDEKYDPDTELKGISEFFLWNVRLGTKEIRRLAYIKPYSRYFSLDKNG